MAGLNDFVVFNKYAKSAATEVIDQQVQLWNAATNNAMVLQSATNDGDFSEIASYELLTDLYGNRNAYGTGSLTAIDLQQLLETSVKVGSGSQPVTYTGTSFDWTLRDPAEAGAVFGEQVGMAKMQYMLNTAIGSVSAAIAGNGASGTYDGTASTASLQSLNNGSRLFGDRASSLVTWIMHSKSMHDIYGQTLNNAERLFEFNNVQVVSDGFGRSLIMTDSPNLFFDNAGTDNYYQIGLVQGAVMVDDNGDSRVYSETQVELENAREIIKEESSFNLGLKGYSWDKTSGGKSPDDVSLATTANWDQYATSFKDTAGVRVQTL